MTAARVGLHPHPVLEALAVRAAGAPDDLAIVVDGAEDLTFGSWARRAGELARGLVARGVRPGDRLALRFDAGSWAAFAVAYVGVLQVGAVVVLVPAGLAGPDARRIIAASPVAGLLAPPHLALSAVGAWTATLEEMALGKGPHPPPAGAQATDPAEICFPLAPLARPRPRVRTHEELAADRLPPSTGWLAHTWAPGSPEAHRALAHAVSGAGGGAATLARFSPGGLCALVDRLGATTCGLTPGLAAALASAVPHPMGSVERVVLSGDAGLEHLQPGLAAAFPAAALVRPDEPAGPAADHGEELPPAGGSQLGMLWHEQLAPGSFNLPALVRRYRGPLDVAAFADALAELARRHEPLRTTFELADGEPRLVVASAGPPLAVIDLGDLATEARDAEVARLVEGASTRPFDLVTGPLFAPHLVRLGPDDHLLVVRLHHTAFDDWSVDVFRRALSRLYAAFLDGGPPADPGPGRFSDVCRRQRRHLDGGAEAAERAWWRTEMAEAPFAVQLPLGRPDQLGPDRPGAGEPLRHDLDVDLAGQVRALARRLQATPFMTVLAAFSVLLGRRTAQDDLVLASVVAGRGGAEHEAMIGCFTRKVLLRLHLEGGPTFAEVVARTRTTVLAALAHQELPFDAIVQEAFGRRATAHGLAPQVPVIFQGETPQQARLVLPGIMAEAYQVPAAARRERHFSAERDDRPGVATRPVWGDGAYLGTFLLLSLLESDQGLSLVARGVFHRPAAQHLLDDLEALLEVAVAAPDRPLGLGSSVDADRPGDELDLRGLQVRASRIRSALEGAPGVAQAAVTAEANDGLPHLVATVVADTDPPPSLARLRTTLWSALPGSPWPTAVAFVSDLPRRADGHLDVTGAGGPAGPPAEDATTLAAIWSMARAESRGPGDSYWQDFSFLTTLAEARAAGLPITDDQVMRCRTPEMLAAALAINPGAPPPAAGTPG
ncbi:MAG: condensation domain-containing protein [Acidimicrobiales bacterium]